MSRVVVLGVGNLLLSDEGIGVVAIRKLAERFLFPEGVEVIDGGTVGMGLIYHLEGVEKLLIIDAVLGGGEPGTIYVLKGEEVKKAFRGKLSMHDLGIQEVLSLFDLLGRFPKEVVIVGIEPKEIKVGCSLSREVEENIDRLIEEVLNQLRSWGVEPLRRCKPC